MDRIRTLLLARTSIIVLDRDRVADALTRPSRDVDVERFEDDLAQLGYVMSLDLAMTVRRLPHQAIQELRAWILETLAKELGTHRPQVPLVAGPHATYARRMLAWLAAKPEQPCPWCAQIKRVGALDPCGHLVCRECWEAGAYGGCPICHRRIAIAPFATTASPERVHHPVPDLRLLHLAFDPIATAQLRFERLLARTTPLSAQDRAEIEAVIDVIGPRVAMWLPAKIAAKETMAIAVARLWTVAPDRIAMMKATRNHLRTATDVLRVATVLMGGDPALSRPSRLSSIGRSLRRAVLAALDGIAIAPLLEDVMRHPVLWKRAGERLHPFELAAELPNVALAFAAVRGTDLSKATFAQALREVAPAPVVRVSDNRIVVARWAAPVEDALRAGDACAAIERLGERPNELVRRVDHVLRVAAARQPELLADVLSGVRRGIDRGAAGMVLELGAHVARRDARWPRRVYLPKGELLRTWSAPDEREPLSAEMIAVIGDTVRRTLLARAERRRQFARALLDRRLTALLLGQRVALVARRLPDLATARPTLWDVAAIHAAGRANLIYVREPDGQFSSYRRRDGEPTTARLARLHAGDHDALHARIPPAQAPTWIALVRDDLAIPGGSEGYVHEVRSNGDVMKRSMADLISELF